LAIVGGMVIGVSSIIVSSDDGRRSDLGVLIALGSVVVF
jgi:hypothetical protein